MGNKTEQEYQNHTLKNEPVVFSAGTIPPIQARALAAALIITIDGPSGAGKSVLGQRLAAALQYLYFDTGVLYRALAWLALQQDIDSNDGDALVQLAQQATIEVTPPSQNDGRQYTVTANGKDITWLIRLPEVDRTVSAVSAHAQIRAVMLERQRKVAQPGRVVLVGRDTGTVVCPDADLKIYVDAAVEVRAQRRYQERIARGEQIDYATVLADLRRRDLFDSTRATAPLRRAPDAILIDSGTLSIDEEITCVLQLVEQCLDRHDKKRVTA